MLGPGGKEAGHRVPDPRPQPGPAPAPRPAPAVRACSFHRREDGRFEGGAPCLEAPSFPGQSLSIGADLLPPSLAPVTSRSFLVSGNGGDHALIHQRLPGSRVDLLTHAQGLWAPLSRGHPAFSTAPARPPQSLLSRERGPACGHTGRTVRAGGIAQVPRPPRRPGSPSPSFISCPFGP